MQRTERAGAGRIDDAVGAAQVVLFADPPGHHVAQQAGERVLLPGYISIRYALDHVFADVLIDAGLLERLAPDRVPQPRSERNDQFQRAGDPQYDTGPAAVILALRPVAGILQGLPGRHQTQQLGGVDRFQHVGRDVEFHRIEIDRGDKSAPLTVGAVGALLVLVVIILHLPMGLRDIGDRVDAVDDVRPVGLLVIRLWKETADADDGQWYCAVAGSRFLIVRFHLKVLLDLCEL